MNRRRKTELECLQCGKHFFVYPSHFKRGNARFCSTSCAVRYRNLQANPAKRPEARVRISRNHADVSGCRNPMYGRRGPAAPGYIDGRNAIAGDPWRKLALLHKPPVCEVCGRRVSGRNMHVHHKDKDRNNNDVSNLQIVCVRCHNLVLHPRERDAFGRFIGGDAVCQERIG